MSSDHSSEDHADEAGHRRIVESYFSAMRLGPEGGTALLDLFVAHAVYVEPFSNEGPAVGLNAIRDRFELGWRTPLPDMELDVIEIEIDRDEAKARWECRSSIFPAPVRGEDHYRFEDGLIASLEVRLLADEAS